jgi:hypothetical protein
LVDDAFQFDADGNGELSREELRQFADDVSQRMRPPPRRAPHSDAQVAPEAKNEVKIFDDGKFRFIESNGIPDHPTGQFPNRGNPNVISPQQYRFRVPLHPTIADEPVFAGGMPFGVALNGVPFDPGTAELWRGNPEWRYEALGGNIDLGLDASNAHVQPNGAYHYHGPPDGLAPTDELKPEIQLIGFAADGFPIYNQFGPIDPNDPQSDIVQLRSSYRLRRGERPGGDDGPGGAYDGTFEQDYEYVPAFGDLDECNGRTGKTPEYPDGVYHYVVTDEFPFVGRWFRGTPDPSFQRRGFDGGPPPGRGRTNR